MLGMDAFFTPWMLFTLFSGKKRSALFCLIFPFCGGCFKLKSMLGLVGKYYALPIDIISPHLSQGRDGG